MLPDIVGDFVIQTFGRMKTNVFSQHNTVMKIIGIVQDKLHCGTTLFLTVEMLMKIFFYLLALS